jgi:hypothetical protein
VTSTTASTSSTDATLPFSEDFEDGVADGFIDSVDKELQPLGSWLVVDDGSKVYQQQTVTSDPSWAVGGDYRWTDQLLTVKMKVVSGIDDFLAIVAVRLSSFDGYAYLEIQSNQIKLRLRNAGSTTDQVVYKFDSDLTEGSWHSYGLGVKGSDYTVYFDEQVVGTASNSELSAGGIALGVSDAVVEFDDLNVSVP